jgi:hypothetical protein
MTSIQKRPQSHSLDALDEEDNVEDIDKKTKSLDALEVTAGGGAPPHTRTTQPPSSFTLVRHRKVELNPTRLSEHCLLASGEHSQMFLSSVEGCKYTVEFNWPVSEHRWPELTACHEAGMCNGTAS